MNKVKILCDLGVGGQKGLVYGIGGVCSALTATQYKDPHKIVVKAKEKTQYPLNTMPDGTCRTIKNQYYKNSVSNFLSTGTFGATGVIEKCER